ncbi:stalk domain-containing protein [Wukongibacter baidiensis]|uniref:stalk domain-containing protein n=1 Tax=Wukongibacter baidiensis TaxID=1723361 RepID=UPI003D7F815D
MKDKIKGLIMGTVIATLIMSPIVGAQGMKENVEVRFDYVNLKVNGDEVETDTLLYKGVTYAPVREVATILDKEVGWDNDTRTAMINDKENIKNDSDINTENKNIEKLGITAIKMDNKYYNLGYTQPTFEYAIEQLYTDKDGGLYSLNQNSVLALTALIRIYNNDYNINEPRNPNVDGNIILLNKNTSPWQYSGYGEEDKEQWSDIPATRGGYEFQSVKTIPLKHYIFLNEDKSKSYNLTFLNGEITDKYRNLNYSHDPTRNKEYSLDKFPKSIVKFEDDTRKFIDIGEILEYLEYKYKIYFDSKKDCMVIEILK